MDRAPQPGRSVWRRHALFGAGVLSLMLVCLTVSLAAWVVLPSVMLRWFPTVIVSGSMRPVIEVGDVVVLRPVGGSDLGAHTVVLYDGGPGTGRIVHRIVERRPDGTYVTKGDANPTPDSAAVRPDQVLGAGVLLVPWIGRPAVDVVNHEWPAVLAGAAGMLLCLWVARFAFDPAYDPWANQRWVLPATVLLPVPLRDGDAPCGPATLGQLLDPDLREVVLERLAEQAEVTSSRHAELMARLT